MKKIVIALFLLLLSSWLPATNDPVANPYQAYFDEAYQLHPNIPKGVLEAVSWTHTHFHFLTGNEEESCMGLPKYYGVMGLVKDGKNYFSNSFYTVYSYAKKDFSENDMAVSPEKSILAYADAFDAVYQSMKNNASGETDRLAKTIAALSELPQQTDGQVFAFESDLYSILSFLTDKNFQFTCNFPDHQLDLPGYFGTNYAILSSHYVKVSKDNVTDNNGNAFRNDLPDNILSPDYPPAIWNPAASCNYANGRSQSVSAVTIHDIEGSYAGAISWFQNCSAVVSAHYVIRSSDGQITQMVLESNTAWHVGSENSYTVGIEHEGYESQTGWYTTAMYQASAALVDDICNDHSINTMRTGYFPWMPTTYYSQSSIPGACVKIKGHQHYPNQTHTDPGPNWDWDYYFKLVNSVYTPTTYTTATGNFYDSGGPSANYSDDERSVWKIAPANASSVTLTFSSFDVENTWDYIYIYDGPDVFSPRIGYWTGTNSPGTVTANSGVMTIEFRSDCSTNHPGWNATWTSSSSITPPVNLAAAVNTCPQIGVNLSWQNSGNGWFLDVSDDPNFSWFWNKDVSNLTSISCPGGFCLYNSACTNADYLKFRPNTTYYWRIWDGNSHTQGQSFTTPSCATTDNNCSGTLYDSGGPSGNYSGNQDYTYTISPPGATSVTLNFSAFDLENGFDSLYIYDGTNSNAPLIGGYTGTTSPGTVTSTGGSVTVRFISDPFTNNAGFAATWNCNMTTGMMAAQQSNGLDVFPNPVTQNTIVSWTLDHATPVELSLTDVLGKKVIIYSSPNDVAGRHSFSLDVKALDLAKGVYFLTLNAAGHAIVRKMVIE